MGSESRGDQDGKIGSIGNQAGSFGVLSGCIDNPSYVTAAPWGRQKAGIPSSPREPNRVLSRPRCDSSAWARPRLTSLESGAHVDNSQDPINRMFD